MSQDIPQWAVEKAIKLFNGAAKRCTDCAMWDANDADDPATGLPQFAAYIAAHEEPPVDPLLIEARKLCAVNRPETLADEFERGVWDDTIDMKLAVRALRRGMELAKQEPQP